MPEMPMSGVRSQLLPRHGALSTRSFAPAAKTSGWFASIANAGSFDAFGRYGVTGLPTVTLLSADTAPAEVGGTTTAVSDTNETRTAQRRVIVDPFPRTSPEATVLPCASARPRPWFGAVRQACLGAEVDLPGRDDSIAAGLVGGGSRST